MLQNDFLFCIVNLVLFFLAKIYIRNKRQADREREQHTDRQTETQRCNDELFLRNG